MQYRRRHRLLFEALIDQSDNLVDDGVVIALVLLCARKPCLGSELFPMTCHHLDKIVFVADLHGQIHFDYWTRAFCPALIAIISSALSVAM